ncbi:HAD family hydrolase [Candidatus Bathyarchaeota archaeon]|nr:HAD family hydrolase [Candidatus Bathyarchaeota archaeon]
MKTDSYLILKVNGLEAYIRKDSLSMLKQVDGIVFDCDGVLVDIRDSYNKAIKKTVAYILEALLGMKIQENLVSDEIIFLFRKTGGFNNDWDTVYGILMFILSNLPSNIRKIFMQQIQKIDLKQEPSKRLSSTRKAIEKELSNDTLTNAFFNDVIRNLKMFARSLDASGIVSVDKNLLKKEGSNKDFTVFYNILKEFLHPQAKVGISVIATIFEEFFQGAKLFNRTFGIQPCLNLDTGMIENEKLIIIPEVLDKLIFLFGKNRLGIASGSRIEPAKYVLRDLITKFYPDASVFLETTEEAECRLSQDKGVSINLKKPEPFSLLKAAEGFKEYNCILYVGDSIEDALMAKKASDASRNFVFAGVYQHSSLANLVRDSFLEFGCDMVIPSVNDLPYIIKSIRRGKFCE